MVLDDISLRYYDVSMREAEQFSQSSARGLVPLTKSSRVVKLDGALAPHRSWLAHSIGQEGSTGYEATVHSHQGGQGILDR